MPFQTHSNMKYWLGKEKNSFITHRKEFPKNDMYASSCERVSRFASRGSITVEASIVVSLFFFAMLTLMSLMEMMYLQTTIKTALCTVGKQAAVERLLPVRMEERLVETIGEERLEQSMVVGGKEGLDCSRSKQYWGTTIMELVVDYEVQVPVLLFRLPSFSRSESIRIKGWSGKEGLGLGSGMEEIVYMTEHGIVYHKDVSCTYLELSIHPIQKDEIKGYSPCIYCKGVSEDQQIVYVTDYGNRYHGTLDCRGLRRKVYAVPLKEVYGIGGCSKCVK